MAEGGDCFDLLESGRPRNFSIKALREIAGPVQESIEHVEALLRNPARTEVEERLLRAVRWSGRATAERSGDKQLLFAMIALECIVKPTQVHKVKETVAKRAAGLVTLTDADRKAAQGELEKLYGHRSEVAHVGALDITEKSKRELLWQMRRYTKGIILTLLTDPTVSKLRSFDELTAFLDRPGDA